MRPAGVHTHAIDVGRSVLSLSHTIPMSPGEGLLLFDTGSGESDPRPLATHGAHVHEDEHVPSHLTVVFIMKETSREVRKR